MTLQTGDVLWCYATIKLISIHKLSAKGH